MNSGDRVYLQSMTHGTGYVEVSGTAGRGYDVSTRSNKVKEAKFKLYKWSGESGHMNSGDSVYLQAMTHGKEYVEVSGTAGGGYGVRTLSSKTNEAEFKIYKWSG